MEVPSEQPGDTRRENAARLITATIVVQGRNGEVVVRSTPQISNTFDLGHFIASIEREHVEAVVDGTSERVGCVHFNDPDQEAVNGRSYGLVVTHQVQALQSVARQGASTSGNLRMILETCRSQGAVAVVAIVTTEDQRALLKQADGSCWAGPLVRSTIERWEKEKPDGSLYVLWPSNRAALLLQNPQGHFLPIHDLSAEQAAVVVREVAQGGGE